MKNIFAFAEEGAPRKRIRTHLRESELRKLASDKSSKLDQLLAIAAYKAEAIRSNTGQRPTDEEAALSGFEQNPFRWEAQGRQSQVEVGFLWSWQGRDGVGRKSFVFSQLHNVFRRQVPRPPGLDEADADLYKRLLESASLETKQRKAPCKYLGVDIGTGKFEADPGKWPSRSYLGKKTHATVYFEWEHVLSEELPHRCSISVDDLLHNQRSVAGHPLKRSAFSNLTFSIEFMKAVAANVHQGVQFKGIAYDQERAAIVEQLPHEGVDVQDEPLYWVLPDGRCECWSVRKLEEAQPEELLHTSAASQECSLWLSCAGLKGLVSS